MQKKLVITTCNDCPYFDDAYYSYNQLCTKLDRVILHTDDGISMIRFIPDDCPLEDEERV